jgi:glutathione peroxidase
MTVRQKILKSVYPFWMFYARLKGKHVMSVRNRAEWESPSSLYDLSFTGADGKEYQLNAFRGKKILFVNTASDCVYTAQYAQLQELHEELGDKVTVIAFPSNEFKNQEKEDNRNIVAFCAVNYGVKFLIAAKSIVRRRGGQHAVFQWLTQAQKNGWNDRQPVWNFSKYLVNEKGVLVGVFGPTITPMSRKMIGAIRG